jgi:hypothetical protein
MEGDKTMEKSWYKSASFYGAFILMIGSVISVYNQPIGGAITAFGLSVGVMGIRRAMK